MFLNVLIISKHFLGFLSIPLQVQQFKKSGFNETEHFQLCSRQQKHIFKATSDISQLALSLYAFMTYMSACVLYFLYNSVDVDMNILSD